MSKQQSFVCYGKVVAGGVQRVLYRSVITPGNDPISKNAAVVNTAAFVTYLKNLAQANLLFPGTVMIPAAEAALTAAVSTHISAIQANKRNRLKIGLFRIATGADANKVAFTLTKVVNGVKNVSIIPLVA